MEVSSNPLINQDYIGHATQKKMTNLAARAAHKMTSAEIKKVAADFESMFVAQMLRPMFKDISSGGYFGGGHAEKIYHSLLTDEYGKIFAKRNAFGLSAMVENALLKLQEEANHGSTNAPTHKRGDASRKP